MDENFIANQIYAFVFSVVAGAVWLVVYDVLKIVRHMFACNRVITALCDVFFWLTGAALIIVTALLLNEGYIRSYLFIGIFFGAILYVLTIGNVLRRIGRFVYVKSAPLRSKVRRTRQNVIKKESKRMVKKSHAKKASGKSKNKLKKKVRKKHVNKRITGGINNQKVV